MRALYSVLAVLSCLVLFGLASMAVYADPIDVSTYTLAIGDVTNGIGAALPGLVTSVLAVAGGYLLLFFQYLLLFFRFQH